MKYLICFLCFFLFTSSKVLYKDQFVFKVSGEAFVLSQLRDYYNHSSALKCFYENSLVQEIFTDELSWKYKRMYFMQKKITSDQKKYFGRMIDLAKILVYSRSYNIQVEEKLEKFFYLRAKESRCGEDVFNHKKRLTSNFKDLLKLEMFLRTRFLPTQKSVQLSKEDYKKAIKGAKNLIQSISDQLDEAVYW